MRNSNAKVIALGGLLGAVALVILCLGGLIPLATYICPMLCAIVQYIVYRCCGRRIAWTWYVAVALLALLMGPDKEAALVFVMLGYYPMVKPFFEKSRLSVLWKLLLFNGAVLILYGLLLKLFGLDAVAAETEELGIIGLVILLVMGNAVFFLLDRLLTILQKRK